MDEMAPEEIFSKPVDAQNLILSQRLAEPKIRRLVSQLQACRGNKTAELKIQQDIQSLDPYHFTIDSNRLFKVPAVEEILKGSIVIGVAGISNFKQTMMGIENTTEIPVLLSKAETTTHILLAGATGGGKSAFASFIIGNFAKAGIPTIALDVEGDQAKYALALELPFLLLECGKDVRFNLLNFDERLDIETQIEDFYAIVSPPCWFGIRSRAFLTPLLRELFLNAQQGYPSDISDLAELVRKTKGVDPTFRMNVLGKLEILSNCRVFQTRAKTNSALIVKNNIIFILSTTHVLGQEVFAGHIANLIKREKELTGEVGKEPINQNVTAFLVEEAQVYLSETQNEEAKNSVVRFILERGRKRAIAGIYVLPTLSRIVPSVLSQPGTVISSVQHHAAEIFAIQKTLNLNKPQTEFLSAMPKRSFIIRKEGLPPIPINVPELNLHEPKRTIEEHNAAILNWKPELKSLFYVEEQKKPIKPAAEKDDIFILLDCINLNPCYPISFYTKTLKKNFEIQKFYQIKSQAEEKAFIKCHKIPTGLRYQIGIEILEKGYEHYSLRQNFHPWRGSDFPHSYIAESVKRHFQKKGKTVIREKQLGNHWADLWVEHEKLALEIAVGNKPEIEAQNIEKDLQHADNVLVIGNDKDHLQKIMKHFTVAGKVQFKLFCDL